MFSSRHHSTNGKRFLITPKGDGDAIDITIQFAFDIGNNGKKINDVFPEFDLVDRGQTQLKIPLIRVTVLLCQLTLFTNIYKEFMQQFRMTAKSADIQLLFVEGSNIDFGADDDRSSSHTYIKSDFLHRHYHYLIQEFTQAKLSYDTSFEVLKNYELTYKQSKPLDLAHVEGFWEVKGKCEFTSKHTITSLLHYNRNNTITLSIDDLNELQKNRDGSSEKTPLITKPQDESTRKCCNIM